MSVLQANPVWKGVTPSDLGSQLITDLSFDRTTQKPPIGMYSLASDGTDSEFRYSADSFAMPSVWTPGASFSDVYNILRSASTPGSVLAYSPGADATPWTYTHDFTASDGGWTATSGTGATWAAGIGWEDHYDSGPMTRGTNITFTFPMSALITSVQFTYDASATDPSGIYSFANIFGSSNPATQNGTHSPKVSGSEVVSSINVAVFTSEGAGNIGTSKITAVTVTGLGYDPFTNSGGGGNAQVEYSSDYGATVAGAIMVGSSAGAFGAFDLIRIGGTSIAAAQGQVKIATSLGGSYSNATGGTLVAGNPVALVLPVRRWPHGAVQDNATNPDYLIGSDTADGSGHTLFWVDGVSGTQHNITPISGAPIVPHCLTCWQTSAICYVFAIVNDGGVLKCMKSLDGGSTWSLSRTCAAPVYLRFRRQYNPTLYMIDGATIYTSGNKGVSWAAHSTPSSNAGVALDMYM